MAAFSCCMCAKPTKSKSGLKRERFAASCPRSLMNSQSPFLSNTGPTPPPRLTTSQSRPAKRERPLIALYAGDWDPSGLCMSERDLPRRLAEYGANVEAAPDRTDPRRCGSSRPAIVPRQHENQGPALQVVCRKLRPAMLGTRRAPAPRSSRACPQRDRLSLIDIDAWKHCARIEAAERESLRSFKWNRAFSDQSENSGSAR